MNRRHRTWAPVICATLSQLTAASDEQVMDARLIELADQLEVTADDLTELNKAQKLLWVNALSLEDGVRLIRDGTIKRQPDISFELGQLEGLCLACGFSPDRIPERVFREDTPFRELLGPALRAQGGARPIDAVADGVRLSVFERSLAFGAFETHRRLDEEALSRVLLAYHAGIEKVYGDDDRVGIGRGSEPIPIGPNGLAGANGLAAEVIAHCCRATCAIIPYSRLTPGSLPDRLFFAAPSFSNRIGLPVCDDDPMFDVPSAAVGTAVLVSPNHVLTAAHTFVGPNKVKLSDMVFVFGFEFTGQGKDVVQSIPTRDTYLGTIAGYEYDGGKDWMLIRLSRPVPDDGPFHRQPVDLAKAVGVGVDAGVFLVGHPWGVPLMLAGNATVRVRDNPLFYANLDAAKGNSGSPVFTTDGALAGLLVGTDAGMKDWVVPSDRECWSTQRYADDLRGERCIAADYFAPIVRAFIDDALPENEPATPTTGSNP